MNTKEKISSYLDKHPLFLFGLLVLCVWVFMGFVTKDRAVETIKYYLTDTASDDFFTSGCSEYLEGTEYASIDSEMKNRICDGLTAVVDETNKNAIEYMYENEKENYEYYRQSKQF